MKIKTTIMLSAMILLFGCKERYELTSIDISKSWKFLPDSANIGHSEEWYSVQLDDLEWKVIDAGKRWEEQGFKELDSFGWYRKNIEIPADWLGENIWIKFGGVNDAYELFVNGELISSFGEANISVASRPTFTNIKDYVNCGETNIVAVRVNDWGNSGGLWRLPVLLTTVDSEVMNLFKPISPTKITPEELGYDLIWEDQFEGEKLNPEKWAVRGIGPRAAGYVSKDAVKLKNGFLELHAFEENDSIKVGAVGTQGLFMPKYGYFECRAQLQKSKGNWSAFWIQSPDIAKGEDPGKFGTEIDIFEYFKKGGDGYISHNLHWAYGPNQKSTGAYLSHVEGVGEGFHTFAAEWTPEKYAFYIDGLKYHEFTQAISHIEQYIILSMELPQTLEGMKEAELPDVYIIDYVKVYKMKRTKE